ARLGARHDPRRAGGPDPRRADRQLMRPATNEGTGNPGKE
ncbi:MAG: hypothetical protein QOE52_3829, partial [Mycobacterium sp.]|nr:hypothetical protein [Mycobacterium sp.]